MAWEKFILQITVTVGICAGGLNVTAMEQRLSVELLGVITPAEWSGIIMVM